MSPERQRQGFTAPDKEFIIAGFDAFCNGEGSMGELPEDVLKFEPTYPLGGEEIAKEPPDAVASYSVRNPRVVTGPPQMDRAYRYWPESALVVPGEGYRFCDEGSPFEYDPLNDEAVRVILGYDCKTGFRAAQCNEAGVGLGAMGMGALVFGAICLLAVGAKARRTMLARRQG